MFLPVFGNKTYIFRLLMMGAMVWICSAEAVGGQKDRGAESTLVRLNITTETVSKAEMPVEVTGRVIADYRPRIIQLFPSTGIVLDDKGHILAFLGYQWVNIQQSDKSHIDIITVSGDRYPGRMVGIDQSMGVAVVLCLEGKLKKTPLCGDCEIRDGATVVTPILKDAENSQFQSAHVVSVGTAGQDRNEEGWVVTINHPLPGVGEPLLNEKHEVLGFVKSQESSPADPAGIRTGLVFPVSQLLTSAKKVIEAGGDIRTGWLGVYLDYDEVSAKRARGIRLSEIVKGGPADKAGLRAGDLVLKCDGEELKEPRRFIRIVQDAPLGSRMNLDIMRAGERITVPVLIQARQVGAPREELLRSLPDMVRLYSDEAFPGAEDDAIFSWLGVDTIPLTSQLADFLGQRGLFVAGVDKGKAFDQAGVLAGDVILEVNDTPIFDPNGFMNYVKERGWGNTLSLKLLRRGQELRIQIKLPPSPPPGR